jgi:hypothetical protein
MHSSIVIVPIRRVARTTPFWREFRRSSPHHARRRHRERGAALLKVTVALTLAVVVGVVVLRSRVACSCMSKAQIAEHTMRRYTTEAYPLWLAANPGLRCPPDLAALASYLSQDDAVDPWQQPYRVLCGADLPAGAKPLALVSSGPDQRPDTEDDLRSWK